MNDSDKAAREAAEKYFFQWRNPAGIEPLTLPGLTEVDKHFLAGRRWTLTEDPLVLDLLEECESIMWMQECKCDEAYASRGMHEPNSIHKELDELKQTLSAYRRAVGGLGE